MYPQLYLFSLYSDMHSLNKVFTRIQGQMFTLWKWVFDRNVMHICLWWRVWRGGGIFIGGSDGVRTWAIFESSVNVKADVALQNSNLCVGLWTRTILPVACVPRNQVNTEVEHHVCPCSTQETNGSVIYCYHVAFKIYSWDLTINLTFTSFAWAAKVSGRLNCDQHDSLRDTRFFV